MLALHSVYVEYAPILQVFFVGLLCNLHTWANYTSLCTRLALICCYLKPFHLCYNFHSQLFLNLIEYQVSVLILLFFLLLWGDSWRKSKWC